MDWRVVRSKATEHGVATSLAIAGMLEPWCAMFRQIEPETVSQLPRTALLFWPVSSWIKPCRSPPRCLRDIVGQQLRTTQTQGHFRGSFQDRRFPGTESSCHIYPAQHGALCKHFQLKSHLEECGEKVLTWQRELILNWLSLPPGKMETLSSVIKKSQWNHSFAALV